MKINKILYKIMLTAMLIIMSTSCVCYAKQVAAPASSSGGGGLPGLEGYRPRAEGSGKAIDIMNAVLGAVIAIGAILITVFIALTGFGMILGSAEEKAVAKEKFGGYLIAAVILTGGATIAKIIISIAENF